MRISDWSSDVCSSDLTLDAGTAVDYMEVGGVRRLQLPTGRVYLRVAKDPEGSRFVVQSGEIETIVLGTRFQVHQIAGRTDVVLEEGRVRMRHPGTELATTLDRKSTRLNSSH